MVPVSFSIDEHILIKMTTLLSIFSQLFTQSRLVTRTSGTRNYSWYYAFNKKNKAVIVYLYS